MSQFVERISLPGEAKRPPQRLFRGQLVEVRSLDEIRSTLDLHGKLDGVPFMPEMAKYCGRRFRVARRADKTCVEGYGVRLMGSTVFLEDLRCDGSAHDGCQRNCLIFWKEAWLKPSDDDASVAEESTSVSDFPTRQGERYYCQSTELAAATRPLARWNVQHFLADMLHGELSLGRFFLIFGRMAINRVRRILHLRTIGNLSGERHGSSKGDLDLLPGEWVEVKSALEISATLDRNGKNRGLSFEPDMIEYCGRRFAVDYPLRKIILEETGQLVELTNTVVLKGVTCQGVCAKNCPRSNPLYWREIWLRRVDRQNTTAETTERRESGP